METSEANESTEPRVAMVYGFWAQNIGNAFFNVGGRWILDQVFGEGNVSEIQDQPGYRTFHNQSKGNPSTAFQLIERLDVDYVVLQGPMFTTTFRALWAPAFKAFRERGVKVILLSAAFFRYTEEEIRSATEFLAEYPPAMISTRDAKSYELVKDVCEHTYNGIDSAFFVPKAYTPVKLVGDPYVAVNFDQYPEPRIHVAPDQASLGSNGKTDVSFEALGQWWGLQNPKLQTWFSKAGQWQCYLGAKIDFRSLPDRVGSYEIVRPEHRSNPHMTWKIYGRKNGIVSDEPFTYFSVYANAELTISDRVHACVATLAYGKPAMLCHPTPRGHLFARVGLEDVRVRPVLLDQEMVEGERQKEVEFLKQAVAATRA